MNPAKVLYTTFLEIISRALFCKSVHCQSRHLPAGAGAGETAEGCVMGPVSREEIRDGCGPPTPHPYHPPCSHVSERGKAEGGGTSRPHLGPAAPGHSSSPAPSVQHPVACRGPRTQLGKLHPHAVHRVSPLDGAINKLGLDTHLGPGSSSLLGT